MSHCLNPACLKTNPPRDRFCQKCGWRLLLHDRYRAVKLIAQGGFGKTFLAVDEKLGSQNYCVVKQFFLEGASSAITQKAIELFKEEAKQLKILGHHSQIPKFYDYVRQNNHLYIIQEFIEGRTLADELNEKGAYTENQIKKILLDLLPVLHYVHQKNVIHRDIKPDNIIRRKADGKLVLVDFGAAKEVTQTALMTVKKGTIIGSVGYTAAEQNHGKAVFSSDIFSLGATCIYLLTKVEPSQLYDPVEGCFVWKERVIHPVSQKMINILDKMTESSVKHRFQSAEDILSILKYPKSQGIKTAATLMVSPGQKTLIQTIDIVPKWKKIAVLSGVMGSCLIVWQLLFSSSNKLSLPIFTTRQNVEFNSSESSGQIVPDQISVSPSPISKPLAPPIPSLPPISSRPIPSPPLAAFPSIPEPPPVQDFSRPAPDPSSIPSSSISEPVKSSPPNLSPTPPKPSTKMTRAPVTSPPNLSSLPSKPSHNSTEILERTIKSNMANQNASSTPSPGNDSPSSPIVEPWKTESVPNPTQVLEDTIKNNQ
jgi:serine/threonine protein kinase